MKYFQVAAFLATISCSPAFAASIKDSPLDKDPNVGVVVVQGEFVSGDANRFNAAIQKYSKGIVLFESGGGDLATGLEIGTTIRMKGFRTGVAGCGGGRAGASAIFGGAPVGASSAKMLRSIPTFFASSGFSHVISCGEAFVM